MERDPTDIVKERAEEDAILAGLEQEHKDGRHEGSIFVSCPLCGGRGRARPRASSDKTE